MPNSGAYITAMGTFLPGEAICNEEMEEYLGSVNGKPSRLRKRILKSNGILARHYALDKQQRTTYQNSELAAHALGNCLEKAPFDKRSVEMLAVATTQGDLPLPGMASIVQAAMKLPPCEILTTHGVCSSGMMALKSAVNSIKIGDHQNAVVCASELASRLLKKSRYESVNEEASNFEAEFLRWMLSDGAAAIAVQSQPRESGISLKIDWIEIKSYASDFDLCMSCGTNEQSAWTASASASTTTPSSTAATSRSAPMAAHSKARSKAGIASHQVSPMHAPITQNISPSETPATTDTATNTIASPSHSPSASKHANHARQTTQDQPEHYFPGAISWQDYPTYAEAEKQGSLLIRQNLRVLEAIVRVGVEGFLTLIQGGKISPAQIDHFVCHYSSHFFREEILKLFTLLGCDVPEDRWFTNLYSKGNTGCAAMFIALEELMYSGKLQVGQTIFCVVPESGRFCTAYMRLTVVEGR